MTKFSLPSGTTNRHQWHKQAQNALYDLDRLQFTRKEIWGVKGVDEHESIVQILSFGNIENATAQKLLNDIGDKYKWQITKETADNIYADAVNSIKLAREAMPIDDNRRTTDEDAQRLQEMNEREESRKMELKEKEQKTKTKIDELKALYPWAVANDSNLSGYARAAKNMKIELRQAFPEVKFSVTSESFSMGNAVRVSWSNGPCAESVENIVNKYQYYIDKCTDDNSVTANAVGAVLGQSKYVTTSRVVDQNIMDQIKADIKERADIDDFKASEFVWRAISTVDITGPYTGIELVDFDYVAQFEKSQPATTQAQLSQDIGEGVTVRDGTRPGFSEIVFPDKPEKEILSNLKANGFRWSPKNKVWYGKTDNLPAEYLSDAPKVKTESKPTAQNADKFRAMAEKLQPQIDDKLRSDRQTNTPKRLAQAEHAKIEGYKLERTQKALYALADLHESGKVPEVLASLNSKKSVFDLMGAKLSPVTNGYHSYHVETGEPRHTTAQALALWDLLTPKSDEEKKAEALQQKINGLQFSKIAGYFPTPKPVIDVMLDYADIESGHNVLEPSAGHGAIADIVKPLCTSLDVVEQNFTLFEILEAKKHFSIYADFLTLTHESLDNMKETTNHEYDRVIMNPPFENMADVDHVLHAFKFLKSGGRLVSVMSPSPFFNSQKKAKAFREFLSGVTSEVIELPENSFKESGTGVNSRLVIIDKD